MRKMDWYFDHYGFIVVKPWPEPWTYDNGDGGDTAHNTGFNRFLRYAKFKNDPNQLNREQNKFAQELDMLEDPKKRNNYRRHPDETYWYSRSNNFSRDQQRPLVMAMGALKQKKRLFGLIWEQVKRFGLYQNNRHPDETRGWKMPDVPAPNHIGEYIRAIYMLGGIFKLIAVLYPVLLICDMFGFIGTLFARKDWVNPNEADDDNRIMATIQAQLALPTPISYLDRKFYIKNRPIAGFVDTAMNQRQVPLRGASSIYDMNGPESAVFWKHHQDNMGPPFYDNYKSVLSEYLRS